MLEGFTWSSVRSIFMEPFGICSSVYTKSTQWMWYDRNVYCTHRNLCARTISLCLSFYVTAYRGISGNLWGKIIAAFSITGLKGYTADQKYKKRGVLLVIYDCVQIRMRLGGEKEADTGDLWKVVYSCRYDLKCLIESSLISLWCFLY